MRTIVMTLLGVLLAAAARGQIPMPIPNETPVMTQRFAFPCGATGAQTCPDGSRPAALIQASDGNFYGTAQASEEGASRPHGGTIFRMTPGGQFTLLFTFAPDSKGNFPDGDVPDGLVEGEDGFLYGTTFAGGAHNAGVAFRISKKGAFRPLYNFCSAAGCVDGRGPIDLVLGRDGNFYGATSSGGSSIPPCEATGGCGAFFRMTPNGLVTILHVLIGSLEGSQPSELIQASDGNFYGADIGDPLGGNIFRLTPSGEFAVMYTFSSSEIPISGLTQGANGDLYGVLINSGTRQEQMFEITLSGDGFRPFPPFARIAGILAVPSLMTVSDGSLWGTTFDGGIAGDGSVFALSPQGSIRASVSFDGANGTLPLAPVLQAADGKIYGTATLAGTDLQGHLAGGTIWVVDADLPAPAPVVAAVTPGSALAGSKITIRGRHFIGTIAVSFNGANATFTVDNANVITATVPPGASPGPIIVTNAGGSAAGKQEFGVE